MIFINIIFFGIVLLQNMVDSISLCRINLLIRNYCNSYNIIFLDIVFLRNIVELFQYLFLKQFKKSLNEMY